MRTRWAGLVLALVAAPAAAQEAAPSRPELFSGVLAHGLTLWRSVPDGYLLESAEEGGTVDVELGWRSRRFDRLRWLARPHAVAKAQINTDGRTSFFSGGLEWRQSLARSLYLQGGVGIAYQTGYRFTPDPFAPGLTRQQRLDRFEVYANRTSFGSSVLFNPNLSLGLRLDRRWAVEIAYEHYSHARLFSRQNPGIENAGVRVVYALGR
ncbi:acyloxyacyl hydrolase [Sphingomonas aracearum]|uniref:Acyloxyacyl hydrolase n=1 Tax=Sphingomonas aracearum TaxID=2283317 RepID=A0A369VYH6_9SPHN|nr:acyloxyacyl hydrolase [Sphingomonas aracearum]RDE06879.1 acyloxyacyl hydrolase [Sphingomonas aracearum]